jgi:hypothetical protein
MGPGFQDRTPFLGIHPWAGGRPSARYSSHIGSPAITQPPRAMVAMSGASSGRPGQPARLMPISLMASPSGRL